MNEVVRLKKNRKIRKGILKGTYLVNGARWTCKINNAFIGDFDTELEAHNKYLEEMAWYKAIKDSAKEEKKRQNRINRFYRDSIKAKEKRAKVKKEKLDSFLANRLKSELKRIKEQKEAKKAAKKGAQNDKTK